VSSAQFGTAGATPRGSCGKHANERLDHTPYDTDPCCTPEGRRCGWSNRDKLNSAIPDCERKNLVSILKWFQQAVTVDWFVGDGTLLGAVTSGAFSPQDTSVDVFMDSAHADVAREEIEKTLNCTHFGVSHAARPWRLLFSATNEVRALTTAAVAAPRLHPGCSHWLGCVRALPLPEPAWPTHAGR